MNIKGLIIDLDGCVYRGNTLIEGSDKAIEIIRSKGIKILFLTNNSTMTQEEYANKLNNMGIPTNPSEILTSAIATANYMRKFKKEKCYIIGEKALIEAIKNEGFEILNEENAHLAKYVICGLDRNVTYKKIAAACIAIQNGAKFIATNNDPNLPIEKGYLPGAGAIVGAIRIATGIKPVIIGKPSKYIINMAIRKLGLKKSEIAIVGDRIETDIKAGKKAKIFTILIGDKFSKEPDLIVKNLLELSRLL
jgi:4-nitrophenyl phosphatase